VTIDRLRIATRKSALALWQANHVRAALERAHPKLVVELVPLTTEGDRRLDARLSEAGGKGLFIKELEVAMTDGRADVAVHSMKDVPAVLPPGFDIPVIAFRADVRDAFVSSRYRTLPDLPAGARIGSSSLRRCAQLLARRPDLVVAPVRGNVNSRLDKLDRGEYDALLLAAAGLDRLGLSQRINERLSVDASLPAAGQGALGVECPSGRHDIAQALAPLVDARVRDCVLAERAVAAALAADCTLPIAAYATESAGTFDLRALIATPDGTRFITARQSGTDPVALGREVADALRAQGAETLLARLRERSG
jgi:hydroxymethylbilane synthase